MTDGNALNCKCWNSPWMLSVGTGEDITLLLRVFLTGDNNAHLRSDHACAGKKGLQTQCAQSLSNTLLDSVSSKHAVWGFHSNDCWDCGLLGYDSIVQLLKLWNIKFLNSMVLKVCASALLGAATSSHRRREILGNFHNFISILNSIS
jgi:hypothetical protein